MFSETRSSKLPGFSALLFGVVFTFLLSRPIYAQVAGATLSGTVTDQSAAVVPNARIIIKNIATAVSRTVPTDSAGFYSAPNLLPGNYDVTASAAGFSTEVQNGISLTVGAQQVLNFTLRVGQITQTVQVTTAAPTVELASSAISAVVTANTVRELPLNGRMLLDLALTVPGSHMSHGAQSGDMIALYWRPGQNSAISIGGSRPNANYFLLDGVTNTDPTFNAQNLSLSPDAVLEFKVQTGSYSAEMGGAGGGQINIVTRTGTSQFHGTAYEFLRNNTEIRDEIEQQIRSSGRDFAKAEKAEKAEPVAAGAADE